MAFPTITTFVYEGLAVVNKMLDLTVGILYHLKTTPILEIGVIFKYIDIILNGYAMEKLKYVVISCKENNTHQVDDNWTLCGPKDFPWNISETYLRIDGLESDCDEII